MILVPAHRLQKRSREYLEAVLQRMPSVPGDLYDVELADGVYLGLPEEIYFLQMAMGTTDWAKVWRWREGWWWQSPHNPHRKPVRTSEEKIFGSAAHAFLLEGEDAFLERFAVKPDPRVYPDLITTQQELISALRASDAPAGFERMRKEQQVELAKVYTPDRHVWDVILSRHERASRDKVSIGADERWQLDVMRKAAMGDANMAAVMAASGGIRLTEVSVFWTLIDGVRNRFRFDSLLPTVNADLKTLGGRPTDRELAEEAGMAIGARALDVQAALSFEARKMAYVHVLAGDVWGGDTEQLGWLERFPHDAPLDAGDRPGWAWVWLFYQKADENGRAPVIFPVRMPFGKDGHRDGWRKYLTALAFYRGKVAEVGLGQPWTRSEPVHHFDGAYARRVSVPFWSPAPMAVAGEEEGLSWKR